MAAKEYFWAPQRVDEAHTAISASTYVADQSGEYIALVGQVPKAGVLTRFEFNLAAVTNAADNGIRCSFQDPVDSTGLPDGTPDQHATIASGSQSVGWMNPGDFNTTRTVAAGDMLCCVIDNPSFTASDSFAVGAYTFTTAQGLPYGVKVTGTKDGSILPIIMLRYDDGTYESFAGSEYWPSKTITHVDPQSDTTPDEVGMAFTVDRPYTLSAVAMQLTPGANTTIVVKVYDASHNVLSSQTFDTDVSANAANIRYNHYPLATPLMLAAGVLYRVTVSPQSSSIDCQVHYDSFESAALMDALEFGSDWYQTSRTDAGAWTDYNASSPGFRRPHFCLKLEMPTAARARVVRGF
jgi:hypothetical protein